MDFYRYALAFGALVCALPACSSDSMNSSSDSLGAANASPLTADDQTPPNTNGTDVEAWLAAALTRAGRVRWTLIRRWACRPTA